MARGVLTRNANTSKMLTPQENERLTRVGKGTPMGEL
jgi:hypothetical protein